MSAIESAKDKLPSPDLMRVLAQNVTMFSPEPGLMRGVLCHNPNMMLVLHHMEEGWAGARHQHPHDQAVYVISGHLKFSCGNDEFEAKAGDSFVLRGGIDHQAWAFAPSVVIDVFTPFREDYLPKA